MDKRERVARALWRAAERIGGEKRLAAFLGVELAQVERWLEGAEPPPPWVYLTAFELIADSPDELPGSVPAGRVST